MTKTESLVALIQSMTKAEKKQFYMDISQGDSLKDYLVIYKIIEQEKRLDPGDIKSAFFAKKPKGSFDTAVKYLYEKLLDVLLASSKNKDNYFDLFQGILKAKMLYERSMYFESLALLKEVIDEAKRYENYYAQLLASKLELDYLLSLNFLDVSEEKLLHKQYAIENVIKSLRKINEQSSLYELLKHRLIHKGNIWLVEQKQEMNDLLVSELTIAASSDDTVFEITKMHKLFQANYLISVGDYAAALQSFKELTVLFESNSHLWANPPFYYLSTLEGVLKSLRSIGNYEEMNYFLVKLRNLAEYSTHDFGVNAICLLFQYELFPLLDRGNFVDCVKLIDKYKEILYDKFTSLTPIRRAELCLYTSLVHLGNRQFKKSIKYINAVTFDRSLEELPLSRTIRLVRLILYYEKGDFDIIRHETRSIKRKIPSKNNQRFQVEHMVLWLVNQDSLPVLQQMRNNLWSKIQPNVESLHNNKYENQVLHLFDFTAWIESKILKKNLSDILQRNLVVFN